MNKKSIALLLLVLLFIVFAFTGCDIVDVPDKKDEELKFNNDYLTGLMLYLEKDGENLTPADFEDEDAMYFYFKQVDNSLGFYANGNGLVVNSQVTNNGPTPGGALEAKAMFYYTYELLDSILRIENIYKKEESNDYYAKNSIGFCLQETGRLTIPVYQNLYAYEVVDDVKEEIKFSSFFEVKPIVVDYLTSVKVIEFDANHNKLKETSVFEDLSNIEKNERFLYEVSANCDYVLIEDEFEVMHDNIPFGKNKGEKYIEREFISRTSPEAYHYATLPLGNGFVKCNSVYIKFS